MDYLIRFLQVHETFRQPETEALARLAGVQFEWIFYADHVRSSLEAEGERERAPR